MVDLSSSLCNSLPEGKPPFSHGFPMVFPLKPPFSYGKPPFFSAKSPSMLNFAPRIGPPLEAPQGGALRWATGLDGDSIA